MNVKYISSIALLLFITSCDKTPPTDSNNNNTPTTTNTNAKPSALSNNQDNLESQFPPEVQTVFETRIPFIRGGKQGDIIGSSNTPPKWKSLAKRKTCLSSNWEVLENTIEGQEANKKIVYTCVLKDSDIFFYKLNKDGSNILLSKIFYETKKLEELKMNMVRMDIGSTEHKYAHARKLNNMSLSPIEIKQEMDKLTADLDNQKKELEQDIDKIQQRINQYKDLKDNSNFFSQLKSLESDENAKIEERFTWVIDNDGYPEFKQWKVTAISSANNELILWNIYDYVNVNIPILIAKYSSAEDYTNLLSIEELDAIKVE